MWDAIVRTSSFLLVQVIQFSGNMAEYQEYHMENAADDHDMGEVDDEIYFHGRVMGDSDTDNDDEYVYMVISVYLLDAFIQFHVMWEGFLSQ